MAGGIVGDRDRALPPLPEESRGIQGLVGLFLGQPVDGERLRRRTSRPSRAAVPAACSSISFVKRLCFSSESSRFIEPWMYTWSTWTESARSS